MWVKVIVCQLQAKALSFCQLSWSICPPLWKEHVQGKTQEFAFLKSSRVVTMPLVWGAQLEKTEFLWTIFGAELLFLRMNFTFTYSLPIGLSFKSALRDCVLVSFCVIMLCKKESPNLSDLKLGTFIPYSQICKLATVQVGLDLSQGFSWGSCDPQRFILRSRLRKQWLPWTCSYFLKCRHSRILNDTAQLTITNTIIPFNLRCPEAVHPGMKTF